MTLEEISPPTRKKRKEARSSDDGLVSTSIFALPFHLKGIAQGADRDARATGSTPQQLLQGRAARAPRARARASGYQVTRARVWLNAVAAKSRPHSFKDEGFRETTTLSF